VLLSKKHPIHHRHRSPHVNHHRTLARPKNDDSVNRTNAAQTRMTSTPSMPSTNQLIRAFMSTATGIQVESQASNTQLRRAHVQ
jgi:hypothetical protein